MGNQCEPARVRTDRREPRARPRPHPRPARAPQRAVLARCRPTWSSSCSTCAEDGDVRADRPHRQRPGVLRRLRPQGDPRGRPAGRALPAADEPARPLAVRGGHRDARADHRRAATAPPSPAGSSWRWPATSGSPRPASSSACPRRTIGMGANFGSVVLPKRDADGHRAGDAADRRVRDQRVRRTVGAGQPHRRAGRRPADGAAAGRADRGQRADLASAG